MWYFIVFDFLCLSCFLCVTWAFVLFFSLSISVVINAYNNYNIHIQLITDAVIWTKVVMLTFYHFAVLKYTGILFYSGMVKSTHHGMINNIVVTHSSQEEGACHARQGHMRKCLGQSGGSKCKGKALVKTLLWF